MAPEEEVCGKTIDDFPEFPKEDLSPEQLQQINDVCRNQGSNGLRLFIIINQ